MRKILLLGGSAQQVVAINSAKRLGYYTVLCDYLPDNPGQYVADQFYLVSTTDKDAVLDVAIKEKINGVLAYASDPAAPIAAYVAERLGLSTNPYKSVETLCNKDLFRTFLRNNGFNAPVAVGYSPADTVDISLFRLPVIIKPVDSSGSKGATVLHDWADLTEAVEFAFSFSRGKRIIVEEYIEKKHPYLIGGDVFVNDGKVVIWGLLNCHRDSRVNPLVPVGKSYPLKLSQADIVLVQNTIQEMINKLGIRFGSMNVELIIDSNNRVWPIDIGPRAGGNMIPDLLSMIFDVDIVKMSVLSAMGETVRIAPKKTDGFYATHNIHVVRSGVFQNIVFDRLLEKYIIHSVIYKKENDRVEQFSNASGCVGILFMRFPDVDTMDNILDNIYSHYSVNLLEEVSK